MVNWSGRRKSLMILLFTGPMLLGLLVFNVYPIVFSFFISLTNRNQFRPFPDCNVILTKILEPTCWGDHEAADRDGPALQAGAADLRRITPTCSASFSPRPRYSTSCASSPCLCRLSSPGRSTSAWPGS